MSTGPALTPWERVLLRWTDLGPLGASAVGRYIQRHMTRAMKALRFGGLGVAAGVHVILAGWPRRALTIGARDAGTSHR